MKNKLIKINMFIIFIVLSAFFILFILGRIERIGYLSSISLNVEETLKNNSLYTNDLEINDIKGYILTNDMLTNYVYNFRISYYSKIFRNSDIYGVYLNTNSLPNYITEIKFQKKGSPFGIITSDREILENIDNVKYSLRLKFFNLFIYLILFCIFFILLYFFRKFFFNIFHYLIIFLFKNKKILFIYLVIYISFFISLFLLGKVSRVGYLSDISINIDDTLKLNSIENTKKLFFMDDNFSLTNYIFTNNNISKYIYNFRISYYSKVFRNSDIYGVYLNTNSLPNYITEIKFQEKGSPFGILSSDKIIEENINNIQYSLRIKYSFYIIILLVFIFFSIFVYLLRNTIFSVLTFLLYRIKNINRYVYILIIFLCFLIMPNIIYKVFYDKFDHTNYENRKFSSKPYFSIKEINKYPSMYETYFNDYIPFRNELVQLKNTIDVTIFNNAVSDTALLGKNNYMFYNSFNIIKDYIGLYIIDYNTMHRMRDNIISFNNELNKIGIDFILMICPDKNFIYPEYMPNYIKRKYSYNQTDKFIDYMQNTTNIKIVFSKKQLLDYKNKYRLYYKYDSHWNNLSGYIGYIDIMKILNKSYVELKDISIKEIMISGNFPKQVINILNLSKINKYNYDIDYDISNYSKNKITYVNPTNDSITMHLKSDSIDNRKILVIRDSFTIVGNMYYYLSLSFSESFFIHIDAINNGTLNSLIREFKPNIIIYETLERYIEPKFLNMSYTIEDISESLEVNN